MEQPELVRVEFLKNQPPYNAGERARRSVSGAGALVALGLAKYLDPPPGLDEFGEALKERDPPVKPKAKRKAKAKAKPKAKA